MAYERRDITGGAKATTLSGDITSTSLSITVADATGWPTGANGKFLFAIGRGTASEEKILGTSRSGNTITVASTGDRGVDGTTAAAHASGDAAEHVIGKVDADEANYTANETVGKITAAGDLLVADGVNSLKRLAKGTARQHLRMNAAAGDVEWAASPESLMTAQGDVLYASAANTPARLALGTAGQVFKVNSGATAPEWGAVADRAHITGFTEDEANLTTNTQLRRLLAAGGTANPRAISVVMDRAGSIVGITAAAHVARTGGSMTFEVFKNGSGTGLTVALDVTNTQYHRATQAAALDTFVAGDRLDVRATNASWTPSGAMFEAAIIVQFDN